CLNCQELNPHHLTASCPTYTKCRTCGEEHHTSECTNADLGRQCCVNCKTDDHASWSHMCLKFIDQCHCVEACDPENFYKYFPTDEHWTWEQNN
ncbi:hypothetical protein K439DRAFT_1294213, partial [Ramaria rubella]